MALLLCQVAVGLFNAASAAPVHALLQHGDQQAQTAAPHDRANVSAVSASTGLTVQRELISMPRTHPKGLTPQLEAFVRPGRRGAPREPASLAEGPRNAGRRSFMKLPLDAAGRPMLGIGPQLSMEVSEPVVTEPKSQEFTLRLKKERAAQDEQWSPLGVGPQLGQKRQLAAGAAVAEPPAAKQLIGEDDAARPMSFIDRLFNAQVGNGWSFRFFAVCLGVNAIAILSIHSAMNPEGCRPFRKRKNLFFNRQAAAEGRLGSP